MRNVYKILVGRLNDRDTLKTKAQKEDTIKFEFIKISLEAVDWIQLP